MILISGCGSKVDPQRYKDACKSEDFETAHQVLDEIFNEFEDVWNDNISDMSSSDRQECEAAATKYSQAACYVLSAEARYLISNNEDAVDRLAYLLEEIPVMGEELLNNDNYPYRGDASDQIKCAKFDCYRQTVKINNELCNTILNLALKNGNRQMADLALSHYKDNAKVINFYEISRTKDDLMKAQKNTKRQCDLGRLMINFIWQRNIKML